MESYFYISAYSSSIGSASSFPLMLPLFPNLPAAASVWVGSFKAVWLEWDTVLLWRYVQLS